MSDKAKSGAERLGRILDGLGEYIRNAPGDELLEDARSEGRGPAQTATRVKGLLRQTVKSHQQKQLKKAEQGESARHPIRNTEESFIVRAFASGVSVARRNDTVKFREVKF